MSDGGPWNGLVSCYFVGKPRSGQWKLYGRVLLRRQRSWGTRVSALLSSLIYLFGS